MLVSSEGIPPFTKNADGSGGIVKADTARPVSFSCIEPRRNKLRPDQQNLNQFLAKLPQLWKEGEARPTHRRREEKTHWWSSREDPFKDVWTEILLWLQSNPTALRNLFFNGYRKNIRNNLLMVS